ncbi:hypothetical protein FRC01_004921 [Tulasnella sp. 417]|nr:hypothetical protein FRC01_004921 [Tulasnella sp. 417]
MEEANISQAASYRTPPLTTEPDASKGIPPAFGLDGGHFYKHYDRLAKDLDEDLVESIRETLDGLLVFSGLFAGVNSAFLAVSLSMMSPDPTGATQDLIRELIRISSNSTLTQSTDLQPEPFSPTSDAILVNQLFTGSLTCSLVAAFFAVLGKQWIAYYKKRGGGGVEKQRWEQLKRSLAAERWHLLGVLDTVVPVLLQIALLIFAIGLIVYLRTLSTEVAYVTVALVAVTVAAFFFTVCISLWDPYCPFQTPASRTMMVLSPFTSHILAAIVHASTSVVRVWSRRRQTYSYWRNRVVTAAEAIRRPEDELTVVQAEAVCRVLETSEDHEALRHASHNIPALDSPEALYVILKNKVVRQRLRQLFEDAECQQTASGKRRSSRNANPISADSASIPDPSIYASAILHTRWTRRNAAFDTIQKLTLGTANDIRNTLRELMPAALEAYWSPRQALPLPCSTFLNFVKTIPILLIKIPTEQSLPAFLKLLLSLEELLTVVQLRLDTGGSDPEDLKQSIQLRDEVLYALGTIPIIWMDGAILACLTRYLNRMVCTSKENTLACEDHQRVLQYLERFLLEPGPASSTLLRGRAAEYKAAYNGSCRQHNNLEEECKD